MVSLNDQEYEQLRAAAGKEQLSVFVRKVLARSLARKRRK
jgi:hypothetical protein